MKFLPPILIVFFAVPIQSIPDNDLPFVFPTPREVTYGKAFPLNGWKWSADSFSSEFVENLTKVLDKPYEKGLELTLKIAQNEPQIGTQGYLLSIDEKSASISAKSESGLFYGLQSLSQLTFEHKGKKYIRSAKIQDWPAFEIRGYIGGLPNLTEHLAHFKMNMLQFPGGRGKLEDKRLAYYKALVESCRRNFAIFLSHEGYMGNFDGKLEFTDEGFRKLVEYFKFRFDLGARAFTVAFDDMHMNKAGEGKLWGENHAKACKIVYDAMKKLDPKCLIWFCPVPYGGTPDTKLVFTNLKEGTDYLNVIGQVIPEDVFVYWTGTDVFSPKMNGETADKFAKPIRRKPFIWDNDSIAWINRWEALHGRSKDLYKHTSGYVANLAQGEGHCQFLDNVFPVIMSMADYLWNPEAYDESKALEKTFRFLAGSRYKDLQEAWDYLKKTKAHGIKERPKKPPTPEQLKRWQSLIPVIRSPLYRKHLENFLAELKK